MNLIDFAAMQTTGFSPELCAGSPYAAALTSHADSTIECEVERRVTARLAEMGEVKGVLDACTDSLDADPVTSLRAMEGLAGLLVTRLGDSCSEATVELGRIQDNCKRLRANISRLPGSAATGTCGNRRNAADSGSVRGIAPFLFYIGLFILLLMY